MMPDSQRLFQVLDATWPAADIQNLGPWIIREGQGGGQRVSAATATGPAATQDIETAERAMRALHQPEIFQIRDQDAALDAALEARGYRVVDPVTIYAAPIAAIATQKPPRVSTFTVWEPLALQLDIWASGGIDAGRIAVMKRARGPKTSILGRLNDHPAASGFVAMDGDVAMVHALEVLPHQRRQSMGVYAMRQAAFWAQAQGGTHISVMCTIANTGANALYSSLGMQIVGHYHYRRR